MTVDKAKLVILGSSGYVGQFAVNYFDDIFDVYGISRIENKNITSSKRQNYFSVDLTDTQELLRVLSQIQPDYVINLAACKNNASLEEALLINSSIPLFLMSHGYKIGNNLRKIIWVGSAAEYGNAQHLPIDEQTLLNPISSYGLSKTLQTTYFKFFTSKVPFSMCLVRPMNIIHHELPSHFSVGAFIQNIRKTKEGGSFSVGHLQVKRDFVSLSDFCRSLHLVLENGRSGEEYNVSSNTSYPLSQILNFLIERSGKKLIVELPQEDKDSSSIMDCRGSFDKIAMECKWQPSESIFDVLKRVQF